MPLRPLEVSCVSQDTHRHHHVALFTVFPGCKNGSTTLEEKEGEEERSLESGRHFHFQSASSVAISSLVVLSLWCLCVSWDV